MNIDCKLEDIVKNKYFSRIEYFIKKYENEKENIDDLENPINIKKKEKSKISNIMIIPFFIINIIILHTNEIILAVLFLTFSLMLQILSSIIIINIKNNIKQAKYKESIKSFENIHFLAKNTGYFKNKKLVKNIQNHYLTLSKEEREIFKNYLSFKNKYSCNYNYFLRDFFIEQLDKEKNYKYIFDNEKEIIDFIMEKFINHPDYTKDCLNIIKKAIKNYKEFLNKIDSQIKEIEDLKENNVIKKGIVRNI